MKAINNRNGLTREHMWMH